MQISETDMGPKPLIDMEGLDIKYSTGNALGAPQTSRELVITLC